MIFTYIVPFFIVIVSCFFSVYGILGINSKTEAGNQSRLRKSRIRATVTILSFAGMYIIFNFPLAIYKILQTIDRHSPFRFDFHKFDYSSPEYYAYYHNFVWILSVGMNAALNPLVYVWRMEGVKLFMKTKINRIFTICKKCQKTNNNVPETVGVQ